MAEDPTIAALEKTVAYIEESMIRRGDAAALNTPLMTEAREAIRKARPGKDVPLIVVPSEPAPDLARELYSTLVSRNAAIFERYSDTIVHIMGGMLTGAPTTLSRKRAALEFMAALGEIFDGSHAIWRWVVLAKPAKIDVPVDPIADGV